ncbi:anthranilate synthase component I [Helicobacter pylori]|nr:anthranilate synthase component I [Helicobacter pylori]
MKAFEIESKANKPLLMAQSLFEAKAITISQLPLALNGGAFL